MARSGKLAAVVTSASATRLTNNLLVGVQEAPTGIAIGTLVEQPSFVDPAAGDFRLDADSPAIDTGTAAATTVDADRLPRDGRPTSAPTNAADRQ